MDFIYTCYRQVLIVCNFLKAQLKNMKLQCKNLSTMLKIPIGNSSWDTVPFVMILHCLQKAEMNMGLNWSKSKVESQKYNLSPNNDPSNTFMPSLMLVWLFEISK
ncbi:hypothetical protein CHS0354_022328 [Potamilus streckersoni]|uniref:Uncharacterized protein n=1 Tax=Potamilus streckersoni TaxID=2493646 RepID=A0AAE0TH40_9BIVA|nr:hypothetical protein CHS0354_022328 [Potamilus streckersoni]